MSLFVKGQKDNVIHCFNQCNGNFVRAEANYKIRRNTVLNKARLSFLLTLIASPRFSRIYRTH